MLLLVAGLAGSAFSMYMTGQWNFSKITPIVRSLSRSGNSGLGLGKNNRTQAYEEQESISHIGV
jgi:hypothetical protein